MEFVRLFIKVAFGGERKSLWVVWFIFGLAIDAIQGWLNLQIYLHGRNALEEMLNNPLLISATVFFIVLTVLLVKSYYETKIKSMPNIHILETEQKKIDEKPIETEEEPDLTILRHTDYGREELAFDEETTIKMKYITKHHVGKLEHKTTWKELYKLIAPHLLQPMNEKTLQVEIAKWILEEKGIQKVASSEIENNDLQSMKVQFLALGLIQVENLPTTMGTMGLFWSLTEVGVSVMYVVRSIKKRAD
jgi:hypothetical protein